MKTLLAQNVSLNGQQIKGPLENITTLGDLVNTIVNFLTPLAAIILFFVFVWGGFDFLTSQGNPEKLKSAKSKITTGIIGFVLLISSYLIVKVLSIIFGLDSLL